MQSNISFQDLLNNKEEGKEQKLIIKDEDKRYVIKIGSKEIKGKVKLVLLVYDRMTMRNIECCISNEKKIGLRYSQALEHYRKSNSVIVDKININQYIEGYENGENKGDY